MPQDLVLRDKLPVYFKPLEVEADDAQRLRKLYGGLTSRQARGVGAALTAIAEDRIVIDVKEALARSCANSAEYAAGQLAAFPGVAFAPATAKKIKVKLYSDGEFVIRTSGVRKPTWTRTYDLPITWSSSDRNKRKTADATVPHIPPHISEGRDLSKLLIMWEAVWENVREINPRPKEKLDPALLEPIHGSLAVIVATWDLTPLEARVLGVGEDLL